MVERLVGQLRSRFVFVVGKGGVGKSTTAGALALALADRGERVHLISTDPAHSVGDLFETSLTSGESSPSPCGERLTLEELDGEARWVRWRDEARAPLVDLLDRGTYLERAEVEAFLDLSLPGVDEVASLLRLTDLEAGESGRVVVDTAPTGHTLRLLAAPATVLGWCRLFEAVDAKAQAVAQGLTHQAVRLSSAAVVEDLRDRARRFELAVVKEGVAIVVERSERVVQAESDRLRRSLAERGLRVGARLRVRESGDRESAAVAGPSGDGAFTLSIPYSGSLRGCDGLRAWRTSVGEGGDAGDGTAGPASDAGSGSAAPDSEAARVAAILATFPEDLILFVGKGGAGKSTCAAACALALARDRHVDLLGVDPAGSLADVLGVAVGASATRIGPRLVARELDADRSFREFKERYRNEVEEAFRRMGLDQAAALDRHVVASLLDLAPPGVDELLAVTALLEDVAPGTTRVVDTAPTGHLLRLLETPERGLAWVRQLMRVLVRYRSALGLDALVERLLDLSKRLKYLNLRLQDPHRSAAVVVTLAGPLERAETRRLLRRLEALRMPVAAVVSNRAPRRVGVAPPREATTLTASPRLRAPRVSPPPVGSDALLAFLATWSAP